MTIPTHRLIILLASTAIAFGLLAPRLVVAFGIYPLAATLGCFVGSQWLYRAGDSETDSQC